MRMSIEMLVCPGLLSSEHLSTVILILRVKSVKGPKGGGQDLSLTILICSLNLRVALTVSECVVFTSALLLAVSQ